MSMEARTAVANSANIIFRTLEQRSDIVNVDGVQTQLIEFLQYLVGHGAIFEVTAVKSDHGDDTGGCTSGAPYCGTHAHGWALDCWPLSTAQEGQYLDASDGRFQHFLRLAAAGPCLHQIGLAGTAYTDENILAAGPTMFQDDGDDHVHFGTQSS